MKESKIVSEKYSDIIHKLSEGKLQHVIYRTIITTVDSPPLDLTSKFNDGWKLIETHREKTQQSDGRAYWTQVQWIYEYIKVIE